MQWYCEGNGKAEAHPDKSGPDDEDRAPDDGSKPSKRVKALPKDADEDEKQSTMAEQSTGQQDAMLPMPESTDDESAAAKSPPIPRTVLPWSLNLEDVTTWLKVGAAMLLFAVNAVMIVANLQLPWTARGRALVDARIDQRKQPDLMDDALATEDPNSVWCNLKRLAVRVRHCQHGNGQVLTCYDVDGGCLSRRHPHPATACSQSPPRLSTTVRLPQNRN